MTTNRRMFLMWGAAGVLAGQLPLTHASQRAGFKAIVFDGFPIFDPRPVAALCESLVPGHGPAIVNAWRTRQFEYQWLRALAGHYADFLQTTEESLVFAFKQQQLELTDATRRDLMASYSNLVVWPDVGEATQALRDAGMRLAFLSNMTEPMLRRGPAKAGLEDRFEAIFSTDQIRTYKPDPRAYQLAVDKLHLQRDEILFVAFAGWDVAGAKWFGYPTFWVNRLGTPMEALGIDADASGADLKSLVRFVLP